VKQFFFHFLPLRSVSFGTTVVGLISDNQTGKMTVQSHRTTVKLFGRELDCVVAWCRRGQPANCERKQSDRQSSALQDSTCPEAFLPNSGWTLEARCGSLKTWSQYQYIGIFGLKKSISTDISVI